MRKTITLALLTCGVFAWAAAPVFFGTPGSGGMVSNADLGSQEPSQSRWTLNGSTTTIPGAITRRFGYKTLGDNSLTVYAAYAVVNQPQETRQIVAVIDGPDSVFGGIRYTGNIVIGFTLGDSMWFSFAGHEPVYQLSTSANGGSGVQDSVLSAGLPLFKGKDGSFHRVNDLMAVSGEGTIPYLFSTEWGTYSTASNDFLHESDTLYYRPRMLSLGMEAPGQLRVMPLNAAGTLEGLYRYTYEYSTGTAAIPSRWILADSEMVGLSLFEARPAVANETMVYPDTALQVAVIYRQRYGEGWRRIDSIAYWAQSELLYVDSVAPGGGVAASPRIEEASTALKPGCLHLWDVTLDNDTSFGAIDNNPHRASFDSVYYIAFSYYDPVSGIESPLGPISRVNDGFNVDGADTFMVGVRKGETKVFERAPWIRVYRSGPGLAGSPDAIVMYGILQLRANMLYPEDTTNYRLTCFPWWSDDSAIKIGHPYFTDTANIDTLNLPYWGNDFLLDEDGGALVRPPHMLTLDIELATMCYANGRLWGAGDPLYPNRVYYSDYDELTGWSAALYIECGEGSNDEIVALYTLTVGAEDFVLVMRHNDLWGITGYSTEIDVYPDVEEPARARFRITDRAGAVSRKATVAVNDAIYFLSPDMRIYRTNGGDPEEISLPIENYLDSYFVSMAHADSHVVAFRLEDKVLWYDSTVNRAFAYDLRSQTWGLESYGADFRPAGSFAYDTSEQVYGRAERSYWLFQSDSACQFRTEYTSFVDSTDTTFGFPFNVEPPMIGDGTGYWQIQEAQVTVTLSDTLEGSGYLIGYVLNETGDTLATDSVRTFGYSTVRFGFAHHVGRYLSVRFGVSDNNTRADIHDVALYPVRVSETRTR